MSTTTPRRFILAFCGAEVEEVAPLIRRFEARGWRPLRRPHGGEPPWREAVREGVALVLALGERGGEPWALEGDEHGELASLIDEGRLRVLPILLSDADPEAVARLPRCLRRLEWADFRASPDDRRALRRVEEAISAGPGQAVRPADPGVIHPLPVAPLFEGREAELQAVRAFWDPASPPGVLALIGFGGSGKTAIAARFLEDVLADPDLRPDRLFVWSFYVDQDVTNFLRSAYRHFQIDADEGAESGGLALLYQLAGVLQGGGRNLLVLDGLERVQRAPDDSRGAFGELEDPLLRQVVSRLAAGTGATRCLITTRFPLPDVASWTGRGYTAMPIDRLDPEAARHLLRRHGVRGKDAALDSVIAEFGAHALTLDHLGSYLAAYRNGDPNAARNLRPPRNDSASTDERRLARVLRGYEDALTPPELDLLIRYCTFRTGATVETLHAVFSREGIVSGHLAGMPLDAFRELTDRLVTLHLLLPESSDRYTAHPAVRDHFYGLFAHAAGAHGVIGEGIKVAMSLDISDEWSEVATRVERFLYDHERLWDGVRADRQHWEDDERWERFLERARETREIHIASKEEVADSIEAFLKKYRKRLGRKARARIEVLAEVIRRCDLSRPIEFETGSVAQIHGKPGYRSPEDPAILDLLEELVYHTIRAGNTEEAKHLYSGRLGGRDHLAKQLGEYARGVRILRSFPKCPNDLDLAWYLRGVGDLRASYALYREVRRIWSGTVLCLQGFLSVVIREKIGWEHTQVVAGFLAGRPECREPKFALGWGETLVDADLPLYRGDLQHARGMLGRRAFSGSQPERVRQLLVLAEVERQSGDVRAAEEALESAAPWIMRSGSVEHLGRYHLVRARLLLEKGEFEAAAAEAREGILLTRRCGLGIEHVDLLNASAEIALRHVRAGADAGRLEEADEALRMSLFGVLADGRASDAPDRPLAELGMMGACHPECGYAWGKADAWRLRGEVWLGLKRAEDARAALQIALEIHETLRHPRKKDVARLLRSVG